MSSPALLFQYLRWRLFRNSTAMMLTQSPVRVLTIVCCCIIIWAFLFALSWYSFHELKTRWEFHLEGPLLGLVFSLFFLTLMMLLVFSTGIILYSGLFAGQECEYLMSMPIADDHIFSYRFQGAVAFSSWAFVLLGSPVLLSYGLVVRDGAPWYYYAILPIFFLGFMLIPGSIGALASLIIVNVLPRHRWQILAGIGIVLLALLGTWLFFWVRQAVELGVASRTWFESLLNEMSYLGGRYTPYNWMSRGLQSAALNRPEPMLYYLGLVWSNGLFLYIVTVWLAQKLYRRGYNRLASGGTLRKRYGGHWLDNILTSVLFFLHPQIKMLIIKDFRTFRRDFAQWAQIVIFLGLGVIYFFAMRNFYERDIGRNFKNGISLLTVTATSFLMCAYTGRFIFPMLSLEGKKFWILGLLPLDRSHLMIGKFVFSTIGCLFVGEFLIVFSNIMLGMPWLIIATHVLTIGLLAFGFSGLSVGLGACMPNFRESDPSKIAVGFGGTVNLVTGLLFLAVVVCTIALPMHVIYGRDPDAALPLEAVSWLTWLSMLGGVCIAGMTVWLPMRAGMKSLRAMEF
jgi:ABC-2 type transport system permease protein